MRQNDSLANGQAAATTHEVWEFSGKAADDPETWYEAQYRNGKEYG